MKLQEIIDKVELKVLTNLEEKDVDGVFISDMLSDVMTSAKPGNLWVTVQTHTNIVSAANLVDLSAVVVTQDKEVPEATIELANRYHVAVLSTPLQTFQLATKLISIGLKA
ncbi:MAG: serine kinase [bacterium]|nr:serine kinase [bacterium]